LEIQRRLFEKSWAIADVDQGSSRCLQVHLQSSGRFRHSRDAHEQKKHSCESRNTPWPITGSLPMRPPHGVSCLVSSSVSLTCHSVRRWLFDVCCAGRTDLGGPEFFDQRGGALAVTFLLPLTRVPFDPDACMPRQDGSGALEQMPLKINVLQRALGTGSRPT
jgi:hypothetical protein